MPALLVARGIVAHCSHVTLTVSLTVTLAFFPTEFRGKEILGDFDFYYFRDLTTLQRVPSFSHPVRVRLLTYVRSRVVTKWQFVFMPILNPFDGQELNK